MKHCIDRYWRTNSTGIYVIFPALKSGWLEDEHNSAVIQAMSRIIDIMLKSVQKLRCVDFFSLSEPRLGYASQKEIDLNRVILFSACAVHYDLDFGLLVQFA